MHHVNTEILKENQNLRLELKELTSITETWLNSSNIVNQCINEQIPTQKKKILRIGQLTEDTSSCGLKDLVPSNKSQRNITDPSAVVSDSPASDYDSANESLVCSTHLLPLKKLDGVEPGSGPKTVKSNLKSKSTFKAETLKGITLNEPSSAPTRGNKSSSASKTNSAPACKFQNVKVEDDPPLAMFRKRETPHAKKAKSSNALRSKTTTKRYEATPYTQLKDMVMEAEDNSQHDTWNKLYFQADRKLFLDLDWLLGIENLPQMLMHATIYGDVEAILKAYNQGESHKGKEIAKPVTPQSESVSEEDSDPEQARRDKDMKKNLALLAKGKFGNQRTITVVGARETGGSPVVQQNRIQCFNCKGFGHYAREYRKPKRAKDYAYSQGDDDDVASTCEKEFHFKLSKLAGLEDTDEEIDEQELEAHYSYMAKIHDGSLKKSSLQGPSIGTCTNHDENDVCSHCETNILKQPAIINDHICFGEGLLGNVIPDSSNLCTNDNLVD
ncbi:retrovirus-related pol polyprotein from transposon TNT 1-94 [Tanacetum coccineum]